MPLRRPFSALALIAAAICRTCRRANPAVSGYPPLCPREGARPGQPNDARGEGRPARRLGHGHSAARHPRLPDLERGPARGGPRRICDRVSPGHRHGGDVGPLDGAQHGRRHLRRGPGQVQPGAARRTITASSTASRSGRPTSTSFATRAGAAARRPTAKIPS